MFANVSLCLEGLIYVKAGQAALYMTCLGFKNIPQAIHTVHPSCSPLGHTRLLILHSLFQHMPFYFLNKIQGDVYQYECFAQDRL